MNPVLQWAINQFKFEPVPLFDQVILDSFHIAGLPKSVEPRLSLVPLISIFSQVRLHPKPIVSKFETNLLPSLPLDQTQINYPVKEISTIEKDTPTDEKISKGETSDNFALILLERYSSFRAITDNVTGQHYSFFHAVKVAAAIHECVQNGDPSKPFLLVSGDFSGIQKFVYTISSKGALKTLRARSFMLEMLTEHIIYEILLICEAKRYSIIYSGGGGFNLLVPNKIDYKSRIQEFKTILNKWLLKIGGGKIYLALQTEQCSKENLYEKFNELWPKMSDKLDEDKRQKFVDFINEDLFAIQEPKQTTNSPDAQLQFRECGICHRDDVDISIEGPMKVLPDETTLACPLCFGLFHLGDDLSDKDYQIFRISKQQRNALKDKFKKGIFSLPSYNGEEAYYFVSSNYSGEYEAKWIKNNWDVKLYDGKTYPVMIADYVRKHGDLPPHAKKKVQDAKTTNKDTATFEGLAASACGADFIGALRMDVDNLGLIFSQGLGKEFNLISLSMLSWSLNLFFKVYLNRICEGDLNLGSEKALDVVDKDYANNKGRNVSVVYAGGDDLFIIGAWDEVTELAFDIHRCFKAYTCGNLDIGMSGGVTLHQPNFPLYQMAKLSGEAEEEAKANLDEDPQYRFRKESFSLFYNRYFKERQHQIIKQVKNLRDNKRIVDPDDSGKRIQLSIKWIEFPERVLSVLDWFKLYMDKSDKHRLRFNNEFPTGFTFKLLNLVETWQKEGNLFLPHLIWLVQKCSKMFEKDNHPFDKRAKLMSMFKEHKLKHLHIPITWIEYLKRGGE